MTSGNTNAKDIVSGYQRALGDGDWKAARAFLKDNMAFNGPLAAYNTPEPYLEDLKKLHPIVKEIEVRKSFVDGDDVCVLYDLITDTPASKAFVSEWFHVEGDKIVSIKVVFDARPFAAMWEKQH